MRKMLVGVIAVVMFAASAAVTDAKVRPAKNAGRVAAPPQTATVTIKGFEFIPKVLTVAPGTTVEWVNEGTRHTVEGDKGEFKSDVLGKGAKFSFKFDKAGTYNYHCGFHGAPGGKDMAGKIIVKK
jgi:plastocyanin